MHDTKEFVFLSEQRWKMNRYYNQIKPRMSAITNEDSLFLWVQQTVPGKDELTIQTRARIFKDQIRWQNVWESILPAQTMVPLK